MITYVPALDGDRTEVALPVHEVTVLEDRALVCRKGRVAVSAGLNRLTVSGVAPVLQDASLRGEASSARVSDARVRRAIRIRREDKPEEAAALEAEIREIVRAFEAGSEQRNRALARFGVIEEMVANGIREVPEDASWGVVDPETWSNTFASLFDRSRELRQSAMEHTHRLEDLAEKAEILSDRRAVLDRPEHHFVASAELDVVAEAEGTVELEVHYVVPNALWRPMHRATLSDGKVSVTSLAAIWQRTGEDWTDALVVLSTARASLGTEPPALRDDLIEAQRKSDEVVLAAREVTVDSAGPSGGGGGSPSKDIDLPGVDDGGDIQNLRPEGPVSIPSDGRPCFVPVAEFVAPAEVTRVAMPEVAQRVFLKCVAKNTGRSPLLAGPVELIRDNGSVGWTEVLFVAPGAAFELGFGPEDAIRVRRHTRKVSDKTDPVDKWTRRITQIHLHVSNFGPDAKQVKLTERIPVAEVDHVKVSVVDARTNLKPVLDEHGFVTWTLDLGPHAREVVKLGWELAMAPGVTGL